MRGVAFFRGCPQTEAMNFAAASSKHARRIARAGADMRALTVVAMAMMQGVVVLPPRSPGPGRP